MAKKRKVNNHFHDKSYKYLLSDPLIFQELMESFVDMDWVREIDFKKAKKVPNSFISEEFKKRESDLIYELKLKKKVVYFYVLIEFQSTVDQFIAMRMLRYLLEFYEYLLKEKKGKIKKLPAVFPVLLYNAGNNWTAKENLIELIDLPKGLEKMKPYLPYFQYFKIIEKDVPDKVLENMHNIISTVFLIEKKDSKILQKVLYSIAERFKDEDTTAIKTFLVWFKHFLNHNEDPEEIAKHMKPVKSIMEVQGMLATTIEKWETRLLKKGKKEGKKEGLEEGIEKGLEKGIEKGLEKGKKEYSKLIIQHMRQKGQSVHAIHELTGIPLNLIQNTIKALKK